MDTAFDMIVKRAIVALLVVARVTCAQIDHNSFRSLDKCVEFWKAACSATPSMADAVAIAQQQGSLNVPVAMGLFWQSRRAQRTGILRALYSISDLLPLRVDMFVVVCSDKVNAEHKALALRILVRTGACQEVVQVMHRLPQVLPQLEAALREEVVRMPVSKRCEWVESILRGCSIVSEQEDSTLVSPLVAPIYWTYIARVIGVFDESGYDVAMAELERRWIRGRAIGFREIILLTIVSKSSAIDDRFLQLCARIANGSAQSGKLWQNTCKRKLVQILRLAERSLEQTLAAELAKARRSLERTLEGASDRK